MMGKPLRAFHLLTDIAREPLDGEAFRQGIDQDNVGDRTLDPQTTKLGVGRRVVPLVNRLAGWELHQNNSARPSSLDYVARALR